MAKLTLSVDAAVVRDAKTYAAEHGTSVSRLVERYLDLLARLRTQPDAEATPVVRRLRGVLKAPPDTTASYDRHLERKYR